MKLLQVSRSLVVRTLVICTVMGSLFAAGCMTSGNSEAQLSVATLSGGLPAGSISSGGAYPATTLRASGGTAPYTWTVTSGSLPPGLTLSSAGTISGSPTTVTGSPFSFTVTVTDSTTPGHTASGSLTISINGILTITTATGSLPTTGEAGSLYPSTALTETGGVGPFNWTIGSGSLPSGLSLSSAGNISGTISSTTTPGTFSFTANIKDSQGNSVTSGTISIKTDAALVVTPPTLPSGVLNVSYSSPAFSVTGGSGSGYSFSLASGSLPTSLTINSVSRIISGVPTASGSYTFALKVTDSLGYTVTTGNLTIVINAAPAITTAGSASATVGTAGSFTVMATGFPITTLAETLTLPSGVTFKDNKNNTGMLSWTAAAASGAHSLTFTASNGVLPNATQNFTLTVNATPAITSAGSTSFTAGTAGSFTVTATGFPITTLAETLTLPSGVTFKDNKNNTGTLAWTAAVASGSYSLTFTASNGVFPNATQNFTLAVDKAPVFTSANSASLTTGTAGSFTVTATGFPVATLAETSTLPSGVTFTDNKNNTATLAWTAVAASGIHGLTFTATNGVLPNASQSFTLTVNAAPTITSASSTSTTAGTAGSFTVMATGFPIATLAETATLPSGVTFTDNKNNTGTLAWTSAVASGTHGLTFTAGNGVLPNASQNFTLNVGVVAITVAPTSSIVQTGATQLFTATITGSSNTNVTWSVAGVSGGNSTVGTISIVGLYTAPGAVPGTNPVTVTATSVADGTKSASASVTITVVASTIQITSLSATTINPLAPLTITGTGFDPANSAISVLLTPESSGAPISVPAVAATSTTVQIAAPLFLSTVSGLFTAGTVDVQVIQVNGSTLFTSNVLTGLQINAPPTIPAGIASGAITLEFLAGSSSVSSTIQSAAASNASLANLSADTANYINDLNSLTSAITTIFTNPTQTVTLTTANGVTFSLNAQVLALSDQILLTYAEQFVSQMGTSLSITPIPALRVLESAMPEGRTLSNPMVLLPATSTTCPQSYDNNGAIDQVMCQTQQQNQDWNTVAPAAVQLGAKIETGLYLGILGGWAGEGLAGAGLLGENAAQAYQLAWSTTSSYIASFVTASAPPPLSDSLKGAAAQVIDKLALGGLGILPAALDSVNMFNDASELVPSSAGQAPEGGLVLTAPQASAPSGTTAVDGFLPIGGIPSTVEIAAPKTQRTETLSAATINPSGGTADAVTPFAFLGSTGGCAGGSLSFTINVTAAPGITWTASNNFIVGQATLTLIPISGTGSGSVTATITVPAQTPTPGGSCSSIHTNTYHDYVPFVFSDGPLVSTEMVWGYILLN